MHFLGEWEMWTGESRTLCGGMSCGDISRIFTHCLKILLSLGKVFPGGEARK